MNTRSKFVVASLLAIQFAAINFQTAAGQTVEAAPPDSLCDYCKDYTDAGTSAGNIRSAYRPATGYSADREAEAANEHKRDVAKLRMQQTVQKASN